MTRVFSTDDDFPQLINRVAKGKDRIIIEQEGHATAAIITYDDLKRLEVMEANLLKQVEQQEYEWLKAALKNPAFDFLKDSRQDIYTLADGKPFYDPEFIKSVISDPDLYSITDQEEVIYTLNDGKRFDYQG